MKRIYLTLGIVTSLALTSCSGFLDKEPSTALPVDGAITTIDDLQNAVNGIGYVVSGERGCYGAEFTLYADLLTNEFAVIKSNNQSVPISSYNLTKYDELATNPYRVHYQAIANVNKALETSNELDDPAVTNLQGQLYAWRGLLHFDLARMFAHIPSTVASTSAADSGIPLADQVYEPDYKPTRATLAETYNMIISDFTKAISALDEDNGVGYMNKWAATALRARAYLYMGDYTNALADAKAVINSGAYSLYTLSDYAGVWTAEGTSESIFEFLTTDNYNAQRYSPGYYTDASGYAECAFNVTGSLFQYLSTHPEDVRSGLIKDQTDHKDAAGYYPGKYPGRAGSIYVNNPKIIRLSEVYLIAAESEFYLNGGEAAAPYINEIEKNRVEGYTDVTSVTIDDIIFEYTKELFVENQIAFAYWRNGKSLTNSLGEQIGADNMRAIMPLPQREIDLNAALVQNPGY
ncbi:MAG: RagB/SusD family nutrient uptake outer membrane protein [Bacteroidaceae bacterium]|nr:RagB/SusD family nutrient uptake outer membrane protein [Bacteroidaceae bacterium]